MPLNESIVEDAALEWLGELGYAMAYGQRCAGIVYLRVARRVEHPLQQYSVFSMGCLFKSKPAGNFGTASRISIRTSPNLDLSSLIFLAHCDLRETMR